MAYKLNPTLVQDFEKKMEALGQFSNFFGNIDGKAIQDGFNHCVTSMMQIAIDANDILQHINAATNIGSNNTKVEYYKNIASKMTNLLSKVQGTAYEWQAYVKYLKKNRLVIPDINNKTDPDLRVWDETDKYEKIIELKTAMSSDKYSLKERVVSQLASAIDQLTQRKTEFSGKYKDLKFKAGIEINSNFISEMITNNFLFASTPTSKQAYTFFSEVIKTALLRKDVTVSGLDKLYGKAFSENSVQYEVVTTSGKYRIQSSTHTMTFQIDFKFGTPVRIDDSGTIITTDKMKFLLYSNKDGTAPASKQLYVHQIAYLVSSSSSSPKGRHQYDDGKSYPLINW